MCQGKKFKTRLLANSFTCNWRLGNYFNPLVYVSIDKVSNINHLIKKTGSVLRSKQSPFHFAFFPCAHTN